ncbi:TPA: hypothetical protein OUC14_001636 [Enterococcus faecalis]|nr:hypothetical protein [Enterococcus faecalis]
MPIIQKNPYPKTTDVLYTQASKRIYEKYYEKLVNEPHLTKTRVYFDTKLLKGAMDYHKTKVIQDKNYSKLISLDMAEALVESLNFKDVNEVYWGKPKDYLRDFIITLILEMQQVKGYREYFFEIPLSTEQEVETFYRAHQDEMDLSLLSRFNEFTKNKCLRLKLSNGVWKIRKHEVDNRYSELKNVSQDTVTFENLPNTLNLFIEEILLPFIWKIGFDKFNEQHEIESRKGRPLRIVSRNNDMLKRIKSIRKKK